LRYPDKSALLASVNSFMTRYAERERSIAELRARQRQEPDEDGFVMVTRGGRTGAARQEEAQERLRKQQEKDKSRLLTDFYRFQERERRKQRAKDLIKKFEADKEKVRKMRERRGKIRLE
jgi:ribosomal RNA-processing protein 7